MLSFRIIYNPVNPLTGAQHGGEQLPGDLAEVGGKGIIVLSEAKPEIGDNP